MHELDELREIVLADAGLQARLLAIGEAEPFAEAASQVAREHGIDLTANEILWALQDARRSRQERIVR